MWSGRPRARVLVPLAGLLLVGVLVAVVAGRVVLRDDLDTSARAAVDRARDLASLPSQCADVPGLGPGDPNLQGDPPHRVRERLRTDLETRDGWQAVLIDGDTGVAVLFRYPVPVDVMALDGTVVDGVPIRVVATRYDRAELRDGLRRIEFGPGPHDVNSTDGACPDGAGIQVGIAEPPADTRALERDLSRRVGVRVFVERVARIAQL